MFYDALIEIVKDIGGNGLIYVKKREIFPKRMLDWFDTSFSACSHKFCYESPLGARSLVGIDVNGKLSGKSRENM